MAGVPYIREIWAAIASLAGLSAQVGEDGPIDPLDINTVKVRMSTEDENLVDADNPFPTTVVDPVTGVSTKVSDDGQMHIVAEGKLCAANSTTTPLLANEAWTGTAQDILAYNGIGLFITSDVASAIGGFEVQFSDTGETWYKSENYTLLAGEEKWFTPPAFGKYFRLYYLNGDADQTTFRISTRLSKMPFKWSSHNINQAITGEDDATLVKAVITGKNPHGVFVNYQATTAGNFKNSLEELESGISSNNNSQLNVTPYHADGTEGALLSGYATNLINDYQTRVATGNVGNASTVEKYGRNADMANATEEAITSNGALPFLTAATTVRIKAGGNVSDTALGAGAREITVEGSAADGTFLSETIATNGASASLSTTGSFLRVYRAYVSDQGTYLTDGVATNGANQGDIVIENTAGTVDLITISQYEGQTQYAAFHIPSDKMGYLTSITITISSIKSADILLWTRQEATNTTTPQAKRLKLYFDGVAGEFSFKPAIPKLLGSDTDVWFTGIATAAGTEVSVDFEILLIDV